MVLAAESAPADMFLLPIFLLCFPVFDAVAMVVPVHDGGPRSGSPHMFVASGFNSIAGRIQNLPFNIDAVPLLKEPICDRIERIAERLGVSARGPIAFIDRGQSVALVGLGQALRLPISRNSLFKEVPITTKRQPAAQSLFRAVINDDYETAADLLTNLFDESEPNPHQLRFGANNIFAINPVQLPLTRASGAAHEATRAWFRPANNPLNQSHFLQVTFKDVDRDQFGMLMERYGNWSAARSGISFVDLAQGMRRIERVPLEIFLPPVVQVLSGKRQPTATITNCWSTAYEILRHAQTATTTYDLFLSWKILKFLMSHEDFSTVVAQTSVEELRALSSPDRYGRVLPGDLALIYVSSTKVEPTHPAVLGHVAVFIDDDLFFEKPSFDDLHPFRLNTFDDLSETSSGIIQFRRFDKRPLPRIVDLINSWPEGAEIGRKQEEAFEDVLGSMIPLRLGREADRWTLPIRER